MSQPFLVETPSLRLRPFVPGDVPKVFRMSQEEGMRKWIPSQVYRDVGHTASVLNFLIGCYGPGADPKLRPLVLGVELKSTGDLVGHVGLSPFQDSVETGYAIEQCQQRKGFATQAVRGMCDWAAHAFPLPEILGITAKENSPSQGVLLRAAFVRKAERVMEFQGLEQPVVTFAWSRTEL